jgi:hypothetical protein
VDRQHHDFLEYCKFKYNNIGSSYIPEHVSLTFYSFAILLVDEFLHDFLQKFLSDSELLVSSFLSHFEKMFKRAVHVMVVGVFECFDSDAFHFEFSLLLDSFLVLIKGFNLLIKAFFEIL